MIILYKGARGRGKTLSMIKDGLAYYKKGYKILRNFSCAFGEYIASEDILQLSKESDLFDCVIMIDEIQIFFDSRRSQLKQNILFSNFVQQIRKRNIIILCTTQYSNTIDSRLRQHLDIVAFPNYMRKYGLCEVTYFDLSTLQDDMLMLGDFAETRKKTIRIVYDARPIYALYDTTEMIV